MLSGWTPLPSLHNFCPLQSCWSVQCKIWTTNATIPIAHYSSSLIARSVEGKIFSLNSLFFRHSTHILISLLFFKIFSLLFSDFNCIRYSLLMSNEIKLIFKFVHTHSRRHCKTNWRLDELMRRKITDSKLKGSELQSIIIFPFYFTTLKTFYDLRLILDNKE